MHQLAVHGMLAQQPRTQVEFQPFAAATRRLMQALHSLGTPLPQPAEAAIEAALKANTQPQEDAAVQAIEDALASSVLMNVEINPEMRLSVSRGAARGELVQGGWRTFLVRVQNAAGTTPVLNVKSPQAGAVGRRSSLAITGVEDFTNGAVDEVEARNRWLGVATFNAPPMTPALTGLELEYRIVQLYSRDVGEREATLQADCGWGEQDLGFRSSLPVLFRCVAAKEVRTHIRDEHGRPAIASLLIRDDLGRVYPAQTKRLMPDLSFQPHVYRYDGESVLLPEGRYRVQSSRGPEYFANWQDVEVRSGDTAIEVRLERWIDPAEFGYYSGDTHVHAAGCSHYESPTEGVTPVVMERQADGEALDLASVLNWGPGFQYQKQFFTGHALPSAVQTSSRPVAHEGMAHDATAIAAREEAAVVDRLQHSASPPAIDSLVRYDVEVSGFPSSHCGHLVLLSLRDQEFPHTHEIQDWPSWNAPILRWAHQQGAIAGYAHSGHGLVTDSTALPNLVIPPFNSSGANEFIADVTHSGLVDFISGCDLWPFAEMNIWYHTLNCGFATPFAGETDFPCLTDACVGGGRSYVRLSERPQGDSGYAKWIEGLIHGPSYFGDGRSHLMDFRVNSQLRGEHALDLRVPGEVEVTARVVARLDPISTEGTRAIQKASPYDKPYWHVERARIGDSRNVPVELIVNGKTAGRLVIRADGTPQPIRMTAQIEQSSWLALRIYPSAHTNPVVVSVAGRPVRASKDSAMWCRKGVDVCWEQKRQRIRPEEMRAAAEHFDHARRVYDAMVAEFS
ncbi:CehA/McbA family metallohydrolase [Terriglobus aquaticus]|nr:CehA/McbA family metallohydrolase [Terriglobus aquaticus]